MLRGYVLRFLAHMAAGGTRAEAASLVWAPVRGLVRSRAQKHAVAAAFDTEHADDEAHVHRMAYLRALSVPTTDSNDVEGVRATFDEHRRPRSERRAALRLLVAVLGVFGVCAVGVSAWVGLKPDPAVPDEGPSEAARERTLDEILGMEEPEEAHPLQPLFEERLPSYVVALDRRSSGRERPAPEDVASRRAEVLAALEDSPAAPAMESVLDAAEAYVDAEEGADASSWLFALVGLSDALRDAAVPFYIDATLTQDRRAGRRRVLLSTWAMHAQRTFVAGDLRVTALDITRVDSLNFERSLLGYTRPESRYALVVRDRIERFYVQDILPSVHDAGESVIVRGYQNETGIHWVSDFEQWAHEDLRQEAEAVVFAEMQSEAPLNALAQAVVARRNGISAINASIRGVRLREPRTYRYDIDTLDGITREADRDAVRRVREAQAQLEHDDIARAYRTLIDARSLSVAEHEVQHRLDYESDRLITVPEELSRYTGDTGELEGINRRAERANAELSAYLSQIARRPSLAWTSLVHVAAFLMSRQSWNMPEAYAAVALFESIADTAGIAHDPLIEDRRIVRAEASRIYGELRGRPSAELSELAGRTWARLYGSELAELALEE
ncbi:MAG: hypothetical protein AB8I08_38985 [Sandaracinaceae bacterium]